MGAQERRRPLLPRAGDRARAGTARRRGGVLTAPPSGFGDEIDAAIAALARTGDLRHLEQALRLTRAALATAPPAGRHELALGLAGLLVARGQRSQGVDDFVAAAELARQLVTRGPDVTSRAFARALVADAMLELHRRVGGDDALGEALTMTQQREPGLPPELTVMLANLRAGALQTRFEHRRRAEDLVEAESVLRGVLPLTGAASPLRAAVRSNLAVTLAAVYELTADDAVLDDALEFTDGAVRLLRDASERGVGVEPAVAVAACTRALLLNTRWRFYHDPRDNEEATALLLGLVDRTDPSTPAHHDVRFALACVLDDVASADRDEDLLEQALELFLGVLDRRDPASLQWAVVASRCATTVATLSELTGSGEDLDEAVALLRQAAGLVRTPSLRAVFDHNIAVLLLQRHLTAGEDLRDLDAAVALHERALQAVDTAADRDLAQARAAFAFYTRHLETGEDSDKRRAVELLRQAASSNRITITRVEVARALADLGASTQDWQVCAEAADLALRAIEHVTGAFDTARWDQWLQRTQGIAALGAYAAAASGDLPRALGMVERGAGVIAAGRLSQQRPTLRVAREQGHGRLVDAYAGASERVRRAIAVEGAARPVPPVTSETSALPDALDELEAARAALSAVAPGMRFAADVPELLAFAQRCGDDLTYLVSTESGGLALSVRPSGGGPQVQAHWLPALNAGVVADMVVRLHLDDEDDEADASRARPVDTVRGTSRAPAAALVVEIVEDLRARLEPVPMRSARLVPVGPLALLPVAAAWNGVDGTTLATGTAGSGLLHMTAFDRAAATRAAGTIAAVTNPQPCHWDGERMPLLWSATDEGEFLAVRYGATHCDGHEATRSALQRLLADPTLRVLHVGAHGRTSDDDPDLVELLLADDSTGAASTIGIDDLPAYLPCDLVFLASCWLARNVLRLPDESIGFGTALLRAGAAHVIAPLWPVDDHSTYLFVLAFYENLYDSGSSPREAMARARDELVRQAADDESLRPAERLVRRATADAFVLIGA